MYYLYELSYRKVYKGEFIKIYMKLLESEEKEFIRIIIGNAKTGQKNISPPTKSFSVEGISVLEMYGKILKLIQDEDPNYIKSKKMK